jgi:hypothetical protein
MASDAYKESINIKKEKQAENIWNQIGQVE